MKSWELHPRDGGWQLPLEQQVVGRCSVDHAFALEFYDLNETAAVRIEGAFSVFDRGHSHQLPPAAPWELGPAMGLVGHVVTSARVSGTGRLEIAFDDGRMLFVDPDALYEAWEIVGPRGMHVVCAPGGAVSVWQPKNEQSP